MPQETTKSLQIKMITPHESMKSSHFFNSRAFLELKPFTSIGWQLIGEVPLAQIFFNIDNGIAISGKSATFGSIDLVDHVSSEELDWFIKEIIDELKLLHVKEVEIRHYPSYFTHSDRIEACLESNHFKTKVVETDQFIEIGEKSFFEVARKDEVTRADRCAEHGIVFEIASIEKLPEIYRLIESTLSRNGHSPSMSFEELKKAVLACRDNYFLFTLWDKDILVAAVVSVKLTETVLYDFFHSDNSEYRPHSALTYLIKHIYQYCQANGFQILDLGISTENGVLNAGLYKFKKQRGAISCSKKTYHLMLNNV